MRIYKFSVAGFRGILLVASKERRHAKNNGNCCTVSWGVHSLTITRFRGWRVSRLRFMQDLGRFWAR